MPAPSQLRSGSDHCRLKVLRAPKISGPAAGYRQDFGILRAFDIHVKGELGVVAMKSHAWTCHLAAYAKSLESGA